MEITIKAYAKINLLLDILSLLENGYHDLFMIMQSVDLYDTVTVKLTDTKDIKLSCDVKDIPTDNSNTAHKAAEAFFAFTKKKNPGLEITIEKRIPHAAGLAGGSADAAAVITALNELFETKLCEKQLIKIGAKVGSDVPFCILGGTMLAQYTGTVLSHLPEIAENETVIIVKPEQDVSTPAAYKAFDTADRVRHPDNKGMLKAVLDGDNDKICEKTANVFEQFIEVADRVVIKQIMRKHGAKCAVMSGSGPSVFGIFKTKQDALSCFDELKEKFQNSFICSFVDKGCEIE